jgi:hypothetical protein
MGGLNTYLYADARPLSTVDPLGLVGTPGWPPHLPQPPLSDEKMRGLNKQQLEQLYKELRKRKMGPEANKVKRFQKTRFFRGSSLMKRMGLMCFIPEIIDAYCELNPGDPACLVWDPPAVDSDEPCLGDSRCPI